MRMWVRVHLGPDLQPPKMQNSIGLSPDIVYHRAGKGDERVGYVLTQPLRITVNDVLTGIG